jgi:hypothetical protein
VQTSPRRQLTPFSIDKDYKTFLTSLQKKKAEENGQSQAEKTDAQLMSQLTLAKENNSNHSERAKHTPLLDHLRAKRMAKAESSALKNARTYLNRSNNAFAAASTASAANGSGDKGKGKSKGQASAATKAPPIPTGPKANRATKEKNAKKQASSAGSNTQGTPVPPKGPSAAQKGQGRGAKGTNAAANAQNTGKSPSAAVESSSIPPKHDDGIIVQAKSDATATPTDRGMGGAERGASSRGRGRPPRAGRGRGAARGAGAGAGKGGATAAGSIVST